MLYTLTVKIKSHFNCILNCSIIQSLFAHYGMTREQLYLLIKCKTAVNVNDDMFVAGNTSRTEKLL